MLEYLVNIMSEISEKNESRYANISINRELYKRIVDFIAKVGIYRSPTDFIEEAARIRLEELEKNKQEAGSVED